MKGLIFYIRNNDFAPLLQVLYQNNVSIQYLKDWQVENDNYKGKGLRSFVDDICLQKSYIIL